MARFIFPALLLLVFAFAGCNNAPTNPDDFGSTGFEQLDDNPVTVDTKAYYVGPLDKYVVVPVQSHTRDAFIANNLLSATPHIDWIESISWPNTEVAAYGSTAMTVEVDRSEYRATGLYSGFLTLWYDDHYMQLVEVRMQVGTPDAVPIGVNWNYIEVPADLDYARIGLINNSDATWWDSAGYSMVSTSIDPFLRVFGVTFATVPPGETGGFNLLIDRSTLLPGIHESQVKIYWYGELVQTIILEVEVTN